jgi:plasmid stability protein
MEIRKRGGIVAQFVVRNIEEGVKVQLKRRAERNGRSLEEEVRDILRDAARERKSESGGGLGTEIASMFSTIGLKEEIKELRGHKVKPARFDR